MARGKLRRVLRKRIAIVGDGHTERIYFHQMSKFENLRIHGIDIKPELPDNKEWSKAIERAAQLADGGYDRVYAIVDLDVIYQKNRIEAFKSRWKKLKKEYKKKIKLIRCNPCFEIWFLLHFINTTKLFRNCDEFVTDLNDHLDGYVKTKEWLESNIIYEKLKPNQLQAIKHARRVNSLSETAGQLHHPVCDVQKIVTYVLDND
jgi:hypothetical protein